MTVVRNDVVLEHRYTDRLIKLAKFSTLPSTALALRGEVSPYSDCKERGGQKFQSYKACSVVSVTQAELKMVCSGHAGVPGEAKKKMT